MKPARSAFKFALGTVGTAALLFIFSYAYGAQTYRVNVGTSQDIVEFAWCIRVTNGCSNDILVPTNTFVEFNAFIYNKPACATAVGCP